MVLLNPVGTEINLGWSEMHIKYCDREEKWQLFLTGFAAFGSTVAEALCCKPESRRFEIRRIIQFC
jgi:hypothetical protein